jgi:hypothetical protein
MERNDASTDGWAQATTTIVTVAVCCGPEKALEDSFPKF